MEKIMKLKHWPTLWIVKSERFAHGFPILGLAEDTIPGVVVHRSIHR